MISQLNLASSKLRKRTPIESVKVVKLVNEDCKEIEEDRNRVYDDNDNLREGYFKNIEDCNANKLRMALIDKFYKAFETEPRILIKTKKQEQLERKRTRAEKLGKKKEVESYDKELNILENQLSKEYGTFSSEVIGPIMESSSDQIIELKEGLEGTGTQISLTEISSIAAPIIPNIKALEPSFQPGIPSFDELIRVIKEEHKKTRALLNQNVPPAKQKSDTRIGRCVWKKPPRANKSGYYTVYMGNRKNSKGCPPRKKT